MEKDKNGNIYENIGNIRITVINKATRSSQKDWANCNTLRFQAYKGEDNNALHLGAEIPLENDETIIELIEALCKIYRQQISK